jgi:hypothetical protein
MDTLETALGVIVFGPMTDSLEGMQFAATKLRQAATLLEYRYAIERRYNERRVAVGLGPITGPGTVDDGAGMQQAPAPAKRKRKRGRPASNGAANPSPTPAGADPLFTEASAVE